MDSIYTVDCEVDSRGHIFNAHGSCQWCHKKKMDLEHAWMVQEIQRLRAQHDGDHEWASKACSTAQNAMKLLREAVEHDDVELPDDWYARAAKLCGLRMITGSAPEKGDTNDNPAS